jgi:hypothetical protein
MRCCASHAHSSLPSVSIRKFDPTSTIPRRHHLIIIFQLGQSRSRWVSTSSPSAYLDTHSVITFRLTLSFRSSEVMLSTLRWPLQMTFPPSLHVLLVPSARTSPITGLQSYTSAHVMELLSVFLRWATSSLNKPLVA